MAEALSITVALHSWRKENVHDPSSMTCSLRWFAQLHANKLLSLPQLRKLGLLYPDDSLPDSFQRAFQTMWANNGDCVSRQYASTPALKVINKNILVIFFYVIDRNWTYTVAKKNMILISFLVLDLNSFLSKFFRGITREQENALSMAWCEMAWIRRTAIFGAWRNSTDNWPSMCCLATRRRVRKSSSYDRHHWLTIWRSSK